MQPRRPASGLALVLFTGALLAQETTPDAAAGQPGATARFVASVVDFDERRQQVASLWRVPVGAPATLAATLGDSPWSATALEGGLRLLRWQVPPKPDEERYGVRVLRVDPATFACEDVLRSERARALGRGGGRVYLDTTEGLVAIDPATAEVERLEGRLRVLAQRGDAWLVATEGHLARFDAAAGKVTRAYPDVPAADAYTKVVWDGGRFVIREGTYRDAAGAPLKMLVPFRRVIVHQDVHVCDLETGVETTVRRRMQVTGGFDVLAVAPPMPTEVVGGLFRYAERRPAKGAHKTLRELSLERDAEWVTVDVATGEELLRVAYTPRDAGRADPLAAAGVPAYLREEFATTGLHADDNNIARVFLSDRDVRVTGTVTTLRTADGDRLLVLTGATFYLCDLPARTVTSWAAPAAWSELRRVHFYEVAAGGEQGGK